jgi:hypothetical protein
LDETKVKWPFASVTVPDLEPFTFTEAPTIGEPLASFTIPDTGLAWEKPTCEKIRQIPRKNKYNFLMSFNFD